MGYRATVGESVAQGRAEPGTEADAYSLRLSARLTAGVIRTR